MKEPRVAQRYAKSLIDLSEEKGCLADSLADMESLIAIGKASKELRLLLASPVVKADKKISIFNSIFGGKLSDLSLKFITILTKKRREVLLMEIAHAFISQYRNIKNIVSAEIRSAVALDESVRKQIIEKLTGNASSVELAETVDPELIGGFVVRVGDLQVDASVANDIRDLKRTFNTNSYIAEL